jgi:glycosyltransferase involved in cell wall biosynthesis
MIVIDVSPAVHHKAGLGRYAEELITALDDNNIVAFYHDARNATPSERIQSLPRIATDQTPYPWRLRALLAQLANLSQDDLLTNDVNPSRRLGDVPRRTTNAADWASVVGDRSSNVFHATEHLLPRFKKVKTVFTLHDLIFKHFPQHHLPRNRIFLNLAMPHFLRRADAIICVSEHTKRDAIRLYKIPEEKLRVIYEAAHPRFHPIAKATFYSLIQKYNLPEKFVLTVGTIEPRKNLTTLFEVLSQLEDRTLPLVVIGKQGWLYDETYRKLRQLGLAERVKFLGFVPDEDLPAIYSAASVFVFLSVYEGFGLPPLEAMACGVPVVSSNASSLPEVIGEGGILLPPLDVRAWREAIERVMSDTTLHRDLSQRGLTQAAKFSWRTTANETQSIYRQIASRAS